MIALNEPEKNNTDEYTIRTLFNFSNIENGLLILNDTFHQFYIKDNNLIIVNQREKSKYNYHKQYKFNKNTKKETTNN